MLDCGFRRLGEDEFPKRRHKPGLLFQLPDRLPGVPADAAGYSAYSGLSPETARAVPAAITPLAASRSLSLQTLNQSKIPTAAPPSNYPVILFA